MGWGVENEPTQGGFGFLGEGAQNRNFLGPRIFFKNILKMCIFEAILFWMSTHASGKKSLEMGS